MRQRGRRIGCAGVLAAALVGCGPEKGGSTSDTAGTTAAAMTTGEGSEGTGVTSPGSASGVTSSSGSEGGTQGMTTTTGTTGTTGAEPAACTPGVCDFEACACSLVPPGVEFVDCGYVRWTDPSPAWVAAHECALAAAQQQVGFKVVFDRQGIDSKVGGAFVGLAGVAYALQEMQYDSWGKDIATQRPCAGVAEIAGCTVAPNEICLECVDPGASAVVCTYAP